MTAVEREQIISTIITKSIHFAYVTPEDYKALNASYSVKTDEELRKLLSNVQRIPLTV